jgi:hypothetical protein
VELATNSVLNVGASCGNPIYTLQDGTSVSGPGTVQLTGFFGSLTVSGNATLGNVTVGGVFGSNFNVNGSAQVTNLVLSSGTVTIAGTGALEVQNLTESGGTLTGAGMLTIDNQWTWTNGTQSGTGHTVLNGTATIGGFGGPTLDTRTVDNAGTATLTPDGSSLGFTNNATWNNQAGSTLVLHGTAALGGFFSSGKLNNAGLVVRSGTDTSSSGVSVLFDNTGTVDVQTGTLSINKALTNEGGFNLEAGALASLTGGSSSGDFNLAANSRLDVGGNFTQQSTGTVELAAGSILNVSGGFGAGTYTLQNGATVVGPGSFQVNGNLIVNVNGSASIDSLAVTGGTVTVSAGGSLAVQNLALSAGTVTIATTGSLEVQNLTQSGGTLNGTGTATIDGVFNWTGGTQSGTGHTVLNGSATIGGGVFGPILDTRTLDNAGSATVPDGATLRFANNATWNNEDGSTLELQGSAALGNFFGQSGQLTNAGLLLKTGASQATIAFAMSNSGTVEIQQGILNVSGNYTQTANGALTIHIAGTSQFGQLKVNAQAILDGTLNVTLDNGFSPVVGNNFQILTFGSRSGDFAVKNLPDLGDGLFFNPVYNSSSLTLMTQAS